jgi:hypothetical protein
LPTIGGLEAIREGIKDAKYIATLKRVIAEADDPDDSDVIEASEFLQNLKDRINPNYREACIEQDVGEGYSNAILEEISDTNDPNDFEAFNEIRKNIADYIIAIDPNG